MKKEETSDFRYNTGPARIPWSAVGEKVKLQDIMEILKFLVPPKQKDKKYKIQLKKVEKDIKELIEVGDLCGKLTLGAKVAQLEEEVKKFLKCKYAVFLTNATAGFEIAYKFSGLKPNDEVIAPAITFIATISYPLSIGAKVVLVDIDPKTLNMDPEDLARKVTKKTKVIVPVHIGGYPCNMDAIMDIAKKFDIVVLEDAAHAFGAVYDGKMIGTIGHFGAFSFHEVKNITSLGEGGILVTNEEIGKDFSKARFVGFNIANPIPFWLYDVVALKWRGDYFAPGNHSATEIQAVVLLSQMKRINKIIEKRRKAAEYLNERFKNVKGIITPPLDDKKIKSTHHLYLFQVDPNQLKGDIQVVKEKMAQKGITQIPHFAPLYRFSIMKQLGYDTEKIKETCPNAEEVFLHRFTHLPLYDFKKEDLKYMADSIIEIIEEMQK
ncbi:MAG: DegT/DnrJ/EryC1/StrS family aminotransferase [Candidatus Omnitrophica bacterium]|nr:DegT/DnrJ/EryC1/StrS family aminotransferase [Candidatus Omnitrophota bacterium]